MPNILEDIKPKILAGALLTLRENAVMARYVNQDYSEQAAEKGSVINVPVPTKMVAQDIIPGPYSQTAASLQLDTVPIAMDQWKESAFTLSEKEMLEVMDGVPNMQIDEAGKAIANAIDTYLINLAYKKAYNYVGTAGTTPFAGSPAEAIKARGILGNALAPMKDRRLVLNVDAESNAIGLPAFQYFQNAGTTETMQEGVIGRKFGFDWACDQNMPMHTAGTLAGTLVTAGPPTSTVDGDTGNNPALRNPRTNSTITVSGATNGTTIVPGDVFSVVGDTQTYVVKNAATVTGGTVTVSFSPAPKVVWATGATFTLKGSRAVNLAFHRDAIALAMRPLVASPLEGELGGQSSLTMVDPISGVPLRLVIRNEFHQVRFAVSALWGGGVVRDQHIAQIAG